MIGQASSSSSLLPHLAQHLEPPPREAVQSSVVSHPLLSTALSSSTSLAKQIALLQADVQASHSHLEQTRTHLVSQLTRTRDEIALLKSQLNDLPRDVEEVEDLVERCGSATGAGQGGLQSELEKQQASLTSLRSARDYFAILAKAQTLWEAAAVAVAGEDEAAQLDKLVELAHLCRYANELVSTAGITVRFLPFLQAKLAQTYASLVATRSQALREALAQAQWPPLAAEQAEAQGKPIRSAAQVLDTTAVRSSWTSLTSLQLVGAKLNLAPPPSCLHKSPPHRPGSAEYTPLYTTELIAEPYLLRFRFHFDSSRNTNRLDKPEWYLNHSLGLFKTLSPLFETYPRRGAALKLSNVALQRYGEAFHSTHAESDALHVLLKPLAAKVKASVPLLLESDARLLAHTVSELLRFDDELDGELSTTSDVARQPIRLAQDVLRDQHWFDSWIRGERSSAHDTLEAILDDGDAWTIGGAGDGDDDDDDEVGTKVGSWAAAAGKDKTTRSARSLVGLLQGITTTYEPLPELSQRLDFFTQIQLPLLRTYQQRLTRSLDSFESLSSAFARAIPGGIEPGSSGLPSSSGDADMVRGLRGLSRLLKAHLSALYVYTHLKEWSEQSFFLEMSDDLLSTDEGRVLLQDQAADAEQRELDGDSLGSLIRKSLARGGGSRRGTATSQSPSTSSIWDEPMTKYASVLHRASEGIRRLVVSEVIDSLRLYTQQTWLDDVSTDTSDLPTPSLLSSLTTLHTHLTHFLPILPTTQSISIYRNIATDISSALVSRTVMAGGSKRFNENGARRFEGDWKLGWVGVLECSKEGMGYDPLSAWSELRDVLALLAMESDKLKDVVALLFEGDERAWNDLRRKLGLNKRFTRDKAREVVRRRVEAGR